MMKKRLLALLLTACMLISILPAGVFATDEPEVGGSSSHRQINPVYENVLSEGAKDEILAELDELAAQEPEETGDELQDYYMSESELTATLKRQMTNRVTFLTAKFYTTKNPYLDSTVDDLILQACAHDGVATHGDYIFWNLAGWYWETEWYNDGGGHYITLDIWFGWNATASEESQVTNAVTNLISSFKFNSKTPTAHKIKTIFGWICDNVTYDDYHLNLEETIEGYSYPTMRSAYGAIVKRNCVCQGYALLLYRMLLTIGVDCRIVTSKDHAWNIVKVGNYWYYADSTWDAGDPYENWWYFLAGTKSFDQTHYNKSHVREDGTSYGGYDYRYGSAFDRAHPMAYNDYSMTPCEINDHDFQRTMIQTPTEYENGLSMTSCAHCDLSYQEELPCTGNNPFSDVVFPRFYYAPVVWAFNNDVTAGMSATAFEPNGKCTRGQFVTFLWRTAGKPEPDMSNNPFVDLKPDAFYYKAVLWAYQNGIAAGMTASTFAPQATLTRAHVVTFLYRFNGEPSYSKAAPFTDVRKGWYYDAVMWAAENGVTSGKTATSFAPSESCTRGQAVSFLYRNERLAA